MRLPFIVVVHALIANAHTQAIHSDSQKSWSEKYGSQGDLAFTGPLAFSHLPYHRCLEDGSPLFDIAVLGMPFDTAVTYRPGARFGPTGIRIGSRRIHSQRTWTLSWALDPYQQGLKIIDCGDVCVAPFPFRDPIKLLTRTFPRSQSARLTMPWRSIRWKSPILRSCSVTLLAPMRRSWSVLRVRLLRTKRSTQRSSRTSPFCTLFGPFAYPSTSLGGDHTVVLPILRSLYRVYGPVSVIHFDAHLDTWHSQRPTAQARITHGSFFYIAHEEGLLSNMSVHAGIRCKMSVRPCLIAGGLRVTQS